VIEKPLSAERIVRALRAAHGLIVRERRRYFRLPLDATVTIETMGKETARWNVIDVSERGLGAIVPDGQQVPRGSVKIKFRIPQVVEAIEGKALVVWDRTGKVGLEFTTLQPNSRVELDKWIARRFEENERRLAGARR
jgi:c-di-GMP-binding flagellar brake protein YcgR